MKNGKIGVGIVGTGGWAKYGHIAALQTLEEFEVVAIGSRTQSTADQVAEEYGVPNAFSDEQALIHHPDVDLVAVLTPALDHARLARLVIAAGKDVYTEWPLSTTTAESQELLALAEARGVRHVVGLQRRFGPSSRPGERRLHGGQLRRRDPAARDHRSHVRYIGRDVRLNERPVSGRG